VCHLKPAIRAQPDTPEEPLDGPAGAARAGGRTGAREPYGRAPAGGAWIVALRAAVLRPQRSAHRVEAAVHVKDLPGYASGEV
jgi:hypothetical protein